MDGYANEITVSFVKRKQEGEVEHSNLVLLILQSELLSKKCFIDIGDL